MGEEIEELFGEGAGAPRPRTRTIVGLLVGGLVLAVLGMLCSAAPGGVLVLLAWMVVEKELDRVESGYLPSEIRPTLKRLQQAVYLGILTIVALFVLQGFLFVQGFYDVLWQRALQLTVEALTAG